jgi:hypothetical protein
MFLELLKIELKGITEHIEPYVEVEANDEVLGIMNEAQKTLHTLWRRWLRISDEHLTAAKHNQGGEREAHTRKAVEFLCKAETVRDIMWREIEESLGEDVAYNTGFKIGIREGNRIVRTLHKPRTLLDFLSDMQPPE